MRIGKYTISYEIIALLIFFILIGWLSVIPLNDYDIWFHLKCGEIILQKGIIHYDVFSYNTAGREWYPYEWLFQVGVLLIQKYAGFQAIKYVIAAIVTIMTALIYWIAKKIFTLPTLLSIVLTFFYYVSVYEFFSARPHIPAYTCLIATIAILFLYIYRQKNYLWLTLPIMFIWTNLHGSMFLGVYLTGAFSVVSYLFFLIERSKAYLARAKTLALYTLGLCLITIAPPLYLTQYRLLWLFFVNRDFIAKFIDEWTPLASNATGFLFFSAGVAVTLLLTLYAAASKKRWRESLWILPFIPFLVLTYMASRNVVLGYIALMIFLAWAFQTLDVPHMRKNGKITLIVICGIVTIFHIWIFTQKQTEEMQQRFFYPKNVIQFLLAHHISGHMFNEYGYGGYLLYNLYPQYQVFFDGRTDLYLRREMPDTLELSLHKNESDTEYKKTLDWLWNKYDISFVLMRTQKHSVLRKIGNTLTDDPNWSLVYWDDDVQLFVRHDGKNDSLIEKYAAIAATPYSQSIYRTNMQKMAWQEYQAMNATVPSARNENAIGFMLMEQHNFADAFPHLERAVTLDPTFESPYMNMAELYAANGDLTTAIFLYQKAMWFAPDRGLIYIRLGQLQLMAKHGLAAAKKIWQLGVQNTADTDAKNQLKKLLETQ